MTLPRSHLRLPCPDLGGCIFAGIERDTRGTVLLNNDLFNYYPATPMVLISWIFEGTIHMVEGGALDAVSSLGPALPSLVFSGPQSRPVTSWSPGSIHALSVAFFPEAIGEILGKSIEEYVDCIVPLEDVANEPLLTLCNSLFKIRAAQPFSQLQELILPLWCGSHISYNGPLMTNWVRSLLVRAAFSQAGCSIRQLQRRIKNWTGQNHRQLQLFLRVEEAFVLANKQRYYGSIGLAELAAEAGFSDQSHMGREVSRVTGLSPARLNEQIAQSEAFWFYRLIDRHISSFDHADTA